MPALHTTAGRSPRAGHLVYHTYSTEDSNYLYIYRGVAWLQTPTPRDRGVLLGEFIQILGIYTCMYILKESIYIELITAE